MSDPKRHPNFTELGIDTRTEDADVRFGVLVDPEEFAKIPRAQAEANIQNQLANISLKPVSGIFKTEMPFSYDDADALKDFDYGNTLVEANLPYCLHLPNHYEIKVSIPDYGIDALVTFHKIWTSRAEDGGQKSDAVDLYAEDRSLYFKSSTMLTPQVPAKGEDGWSALYRGRNVEGIKDRNGVFRYTKVYIQFDLDIPENFEEKSVGPQKALVARAQEIALVTMNRVIEVYRDVTNEGYIRRLGRLQISLVYFIPQNFGWYLLEPNLETARMNRSRQEMEAIKKSLASESRPKLYKTLMLNARDSFETRDYTLAIVESFQALEIFLEDYLVDAFVARGDDEATYGANLDRNWKTKDRLNIVLQELKGVKLNEQIFWDEWCNRYDQTRNEVIHRGKEPASDETEKTLAINDKVIEWISSL